MNNAGNPALEKFLSRDDIPANTANSKDCKNIYKEFLKSIELPVSYQEKIDNSKYTKHLYSETEINGLKEKWQKNILSFFIV